MLRKLVSFTLAGAAMAALALAQEGHPLTGTWHGEWGPAAKRQPIVMFLKWNNKSVEGTLNPGRNSTPLKAVTLDADKWMVHFEAETKAGEKITADGKMTDIGSYNRSISGTWTQGTAKSEFKLTRD